MNRPIVRSIPLGVALPVLVLAVFGTLFASLLIQQQHQWSDHLAQQDLEHAGGTMFRLKRMVGDALARGELHAAERALTIHGVAPGLVALAAVDGDGRVLFATRLAWKGQAAGAVLPGFEPARFAEMLASHRHAIRLTADGRFLDAYYPLPMWPAEGELRPTAVGGLYLRLDRAADHDYLADAMADNLLLGLVVLLLMGSLLWGLRQFVTRPLHALGEAAATLPHGEWSGIRIRGKGEVAQLGHALAQAGDALGHVLRELREREAALRRLNEELESRVASRTAQLQRANDELEAFTYSVSHDLRAPLRSIDGFCKLLLDRHAGDLESQAQDYLTRVRNASQRMGVLIDDLVSLSRINRYELRCERVDLSALAGQVIAELRAGEPQRRVDTVIEPGLTADCDPRLARVVLDNLLGNAWKYSAHSEAPRIEFAAAMGSGTPGFVVRDNGVGFDMQYADKLFAPFQRLHHASEFEGSGIGLASVQRAVQRQGGHVFAQAEPGVGAEFFFNFGDALAARPVARDASAPELRLSG